MTSWTTFIRSRQVLDNVRHSILVLDHVFKNSLPLVFLTLDPKKAFDRVNCSFLNCALKKFGFDNSWIQIINSIYKNPKARIKIKEALSEPFVLERGMRQDCPISPLLFAIFIEPLSQIVLQDPNISGIWLSQVPQIIALFADNILLYLTNPEQSIPHMAETSSLFGSISGYKLNIPKSQPLCLGFSPSKMLMAHLPLKWKANSVKHLGINIPKDPRLLYDSNYPHLIYTIRSGLDR